MSKSAQVATMWVGVAAWMVAGASIPVIAHNPAVMISVTILLVGATCCAQIGRIVGAQVEGIRIDNDRYIDNHTTPDVYFKAGRVYERENLDCGSPRPSIPSNVIYIGSRRPSDDSCQRATLAVPENYPSGTEGSPN